MEMLLFSVITLSMVSSSYSDFRNNKITPDEELSNLMNECKSEPNSLWIGKRCYFFNKNLQSYEDAQDYCQFHFDRKKTVQKTRGRLYEPRHFSNFISMYRRAQEIFGSRYPGFWLGIDNIQNFKYASDGKSLSDATWVPWAPNRPNEDSNETCLTAFRFKWFDIKCSDISWSICESIPDI